MVGVTRGEVAAQAPAEPREPAPKPAGPIAGATKANRTIVGMPVTAQQHAAKAASAEPPARPAPPGAVGRTMVGVAAPGAPPAGAARAGGTLVGVARPGIAPLMPGVERDPGPADPDPPNYAPARELGATLGAEALGDVRVPPQMEAASARDKQRRAMAMDVRARRRGPAAAPPEESISRRALAVVLAAGALSLCAVLVALFWPSPPPITARPRADAGGREGVELSCKSCPDGTKVTIGEASALMAAGVAMVPLPAALSVGDNRFKVAVDRPGNGRDETVGVTVHVAYRIRPDLSALQAEKPAIQIVAEATTGTTVTVGGRKIPLAAGRGAETIDLADACTGLSAEVKTIARQIPYVITPEDGPAEQGVVNVSVGVVPLHLDAPAAIGPAGDAAAPPPHVITDGPSFLLAGGTMKGAEVLAAGRPIPVRPDGSFAQVMNVSSVGATTIEVRAKMPGMAPRLTTIKVRRVESLERAARSFGQGEASVGYRDLVANLGAAVGKAVVLAGEVAETKKQGYQTVMLLDVGASSGCGGGACTVRLVQGADNPAKRGDALRVFGHVARAFSVPGRADIPEIEVDFTLRDAAGKGGK